MWWSSRRSKLPHKYSTAPTTNRSRRFAPRSQRPTKQAAPRLSKSNGNPGSTDLSASTLLLVLDECPHRDARSCIVVRLHVPVQMNTFLLPSFLLCRVVSLMVRVMSSQMVLLPVQRLATAMALAQYRRERHMRHLLVPWRKFYCKVMLDLADDQGRYPMAQRRIWCLSSAMPCTPRHATPSHATPDRTTRICIRRPLPAQELFNTGM